jgi:phosphoglycolate phosphatase
MAPTLVLDLDGTLVDSLPDLAAALNRVMRARGLADFAAGEVAGLVGDGSAVLIERAFRARLAVPDPAALTEFLSDYGAHATAATQLYPGVAAGLHEAGAAGWRLAVCTNKPQAAALRVVAAMGLEEVFAAVAGGDRFGVRKPDPGHLRGTLAAAGGGAAAAVMVGDHRNDVAAARGLGIPCIFAARGYGPASMAEGAAAIAANFAEVPALAARLLES